MKKSNILLGLVALFSITFAACEDRDYPAGLEELENYYYAGFLPWNNTGTESVFRTQTTLVKFPVQFNSAYVRDYDAGYNFTLVTTGIPNPAILGQDFNIVDKNGATLAPVNGIFTRYIPKTVRMVDTIYVKVLNSAVLGTRKIEIDLVKNETSQYTVGTFTQSFKRFLEVK
jgi:hypothetical protein